MQISQMHTSLNAELFNYALCVAWLERTAPGEVAIGPRNCFPTLTRLNLRGACGLRRAVKKRECLLCGGESKLRGAASLLLEAIKGRRVRSGDAHFLCPCALAGTLARLEDVSCSDRHRSDRIALAICFAKLASLEIMVSSVCVA